ncbi:MAG: hypothetical protein FJX47_18755, partial [Alphaproteobacteria bacterium]|nr:hypothetical protein [Alphaproteobacteria bacterium]
KSVGTRLVMADRSGYVLTEAGQRLFAHAEGIEGRLAAAVDEVGGRDLSVSGLVRLGTTEGFGGLYLTPRLKAFLACHPDLAVDLITLPRLANITSREADIVVTLEPPTSGPYVVNRLTDFRYFLYASPDYLARAKPIRRRADLAGHDFVGYVEDMLMSLSLRFVYELAPEPRLVFRSSGMIAQVEACAAGIGLAVLAGYMADQDRRLVRVLPDEVGFGLTFHLATHVDLLRLARVRLVWDFLKAQVAKDQDIMLGRRVGAPPPQSAKRSTVKTPSGTLRSRSSM